MFVMQVGLDAVLSETSEGSWVLFAPTNEAFANLGDDTLGVIAIDTELLTNILLYHLAGGEDLSASDLECGGSLEMTSGTNTTTVCDGDAIYQTGDANEQGSEPEIILPDILTCNGRIHVTNQVILPSLDDVPVPNVPEEEDITQEQECQPLGTHVRIIYFYLLNLFRNILTHSHAGLKFVTGQPILYVTRPIYRRSAPF